MAPARLSRWPRQLLAWLVAEAQRTQHVDPDEAYGDSRLSVLHAPRP
jgi:hypothetical protein